eukprot:2388071-Alexandrium_andersonii.AAC.1
MPRGDGDDSASGLGLAATVELEPLLAVPQVGHAALQCRDGALRALRRVLGVDLGEHLRSPEL